MSALRLAYADPPYPGCAHLYRAEDSYGGEVDHAELIARLCEYDGWALSTNEKSLQELLALAPVGVRVLAWCKPNAPPFFKNPYPAWEPVICVPARSVTSEATRSYLEAGAPTGFITAGLTGAKTPLFCDWLFRCLGAEPGDTLDDLYPGTGVVTRTWEGWTHQTRLPLGRPDRRKHARLSGTESLFGAAVERTQE